MELKTIGPHVLVDRRLNRGRLLLCAGNHDKAEAAVADERLELACTPAHLNVCVALPRHVVWFAAKINSDQLQDRMPFGLVETMWRFQRLRR